MYKIPLRQFGKKVESYDAELERLKFIVPLYKLTKEEIDENIERIIKHLAKHVGNEKHNMDAVGQFISFRIEKNGQVYEKLIIPFLFNMIILAPYYFNGIPVDEKCLFEPQSFTNGEYMKAMNKYIGFAKKHYTFYDVNEHLEYVKIKMNRFCVVVGEKFGLTISTDQFITLMQQNDRIRDIIMTRFHVPKDISPTELENLISENHKELNYAMNASGLDIGVYNSVGLFNPLQLKEFCIHLGLKPDIKGNTIPLTSNTNIINGLRDNVSYMIDGFGGRKAELVRMKVASAGELEKNIALLMADIRFVDADGEVEMCDSTRLLEINISSMTKLQQMEGRVYTTEKHGEDFTILDSTKDIHLIGQTLYFKTPITCTHPNKEKVCKACYGFNLSNINYLYHIGLIAAYILGDEIQQVLLSAKHALATKSNEIEFGDEIIEFFLLDGNKLFLNLESLMDESSRIGDFYLEFNPGSVQKDKIGNKSLENYITEIVIYDAKDNTRAVITEVNGQNIHLSSFLYDIYYNEMMKNIAEDSIRIPFKKLVDLCMNIDEDEETEPEMFQINYKNNELAAPLNMLTEILGKTSIIKSYETYSALVEELNDLFSKSKISTSLVNVELLCRNLVRDPETYKLVDWTKEDAEYELCTVEKAIFSSDSPITSLMFTSQPTQLKGAYGTYEKTGTSMFDVFIDPKN